MKPNYLKYRKYIADIQNDLQFSTYEQVIRKKILVYVTRHSDDSLWQIKKDISEIFGPQYQLFVDKTFAEYDGIIDYVNDKYKDLGIDINRNMGRIIDIEAINKTRLGKYEEQEVSQISRYVRQAIIDKKPVSELKRDLERIGGRVTGYAQTIARSQIAGYGRESKTAKALSGAVYYAEYVGYIREHTRLFCRERLQGNSPRKDNFYHVDEIHALSNGPKQLKPVITYCGGWNCNHDWEWDALYKGSEK